MTVTNPSLTNSDPLSTAGSAKCSVAESSQDRLTESLAPTSDGVEFTDQDCDAEAPGTSSEGRSPATGLTSQPWHRAQRVRLWLSHWAW